MGRSAGKGIDYPIQYSWASLVAQLVKNPPAMLETWVRSLDWEDSPGGGHGKPLQYSCLENPRAHRSLAGYSPWGLKELDTTEQLSTQHYVLKTEKTITFSPHSGSSFLLTDREMLNLTVSKSLTQ